MAVFLLLFSFGAGIIGNWESLGPSKPVAGFYIKNRTHCEFLICWLYCSMGDFIGMGYYRSYFYTRVKGYKSSASGPEAVDIDKC